MVVDTVEVHPMLQAAHMAFWHPVRQARDARQIQHPMYQAATARVEQVHHPRLQDVVARATWTEVGQVQHSKWQAVVAQV